jgi:hypothetical protein
LPGGEFRVLWIWVWRGALGVGWSGWRLVATGGEMSEKAQRFR